MLSILVCGWLMKRQLNVLEGGASGAEGDFKRMKVAACRFYLEQIVPEAHGLAAAATAPADILYSVPAEAFAV
jgi:hypothetical protein